MQSFVLFASALVALISITHGQGYTEEYYWNGTLSIPVDDRKAIQSGRIYVQLPNGSTPIDIRVLESVNVTLDCGLHFVMSNGSISNLNTIWKLRTRNFNGDLESNPLVFISGTFRDGIEIFGQKDRFLRVANALASNIGEFTCEVCYDEHSSLERKCSIYKADIGFPPVINRTGMLPPNSIRIGTDICIDPQSPALVVSVVCAQIGSINPEPVSSYTFNNQPINSAYFFISQFSSETGLYNMIDVHPGLLLENNMEGSLNCVLQNRFGNDSETTKILPSPPINGTITVHGGDGTIVSPACLRSDNDLFVSCSDSTPGSTVAWYVNGVLQIDNTRFRQRANVTGNYTCVITNSCESITNTTIINEPPIRTVGLIYLYNGTLSSLVSVGNRTCVSRTDWASLRVYLYCFPQFKNVPVYSTIIHYFWSTPGGGNLTGYLIIASSIGAYTCTSGNLCGSSQATVEVLGLVELIKGTGTGIDQTVDIGSRLCLNSNNEATINCNTSFGTNVARTWFRNSSVISGVTGSSYTAMPSDVGSTITCRVTNDCGMDMAATQVITHVPVTINGSIPGLLNISDSGCKRPGVTNTTADLCPIDGERVIISCSSDARYIISGPGGSTTDTSLVINRFSLSDSGRYLCRSQNTVCGAAESSILVTASGVPPLIITDPPGTPTLIPPPAVIYATVSIGRDVCLLHHQFVWLDCWTQSGTKPITRTWTAASTGDRIISIGVFFILVSVNDTDVYTCKASNPFGTSIASSRVDRHLDVAMVAASPQGSRCDQLKRRPPGVDYCAFVGDNLTLSCRVNAPSITTMIYNGGSSRGSDISLTPVLLSAEGNYLCNATNLCGYSTDALNLKVYDPARIDRKQTLPAPGYDERIIGVGRSDEPNKIILGRTVKLFCPFTGIDPANTTWLRVQPDGITVEVDTSLPVFSMNNTGNMSVLSISPFTRECEGTYRCTTTNIAGDDEGDVVLQVGCADTYRHCQGITKYCYDDAVRSVCCSTCRHF